MGLPAPSPLPGTPSQLLTHLTTPTHGVYCTTYPTAGEDNYCYELRHAE